MEKPETILIVEDDRDLANVLAMNLREIGYRTDMAHDGRTGLRKAQEGTCALLILDIMLPQLDGLSICRKVRETNPKTPILMLTARSEELDRVLGLDLGADDYLSKPFAMRELMARVKALLRRVHADRGAGPAESSGRTEIGGIVIDPDLRKVTVEGRTVELTVKEFDLLALFARNPGRTYSRTDLLNLVWGYQFDGYEHTVNTHINRLRNKIETDTAHPRYLRTVWGVGYRFAEPGDLGP